jgi:hypothetical protein
MAKAPARPPKERSGGARAETGRGARPRSFAAAATDAQAVGGEATDTAHRRHGASRLRAHSQCRTKGWAKFISTGGDA